MIKRGKRGLSTVIATLLIILLVIVAVVIVWTVIRTIITQNSEEISLGKFTIDLKIVSIKQTSADVSVKVKRNPGEGELEGIIFSVFDGKETHLYEKHNVSLNPLDVKTFVINYQGKIISISIFPIIETSPGKTVTGNLADTFYVTSTGEGYIPSDCIPNCEDKECGDNGCGGSCGICPENLPNCIQGTCEADSGGGLPEADCSCATDICTGTTCSDGIGGSCPGLIEPDCNNNQIMCGDSLNDCGSCGTCDVGYHCDAGACVRDCIPDCTNLECGPDANGCGVSCGTCDTEAGEWCDDGTCAITPCEPDCTDRECGPDANGCGVSCGTCDTEAGEWCSEDAICLSEEIVNTGIIFSVWPINTGIYFDSNDLPKSSASYTNYWVKFPGSNEFDCLQIDNFVTPVIPEIYDMSYIKLVTSSSEIKSGDTYEVWETYQGCLS